MLSVWLLYVLLLLEREQICSQTAPLQCSTLISNIIMYCFCACIFQAMKWCCYVKWWLIHNFIWTVIYIDTHLNVLHLHTFVFTNFPTMWVWVGILFPTTCSVQPPKCTSNCNGAITYYVKRMTLEMLQTIWGLPISLLFTFTSSISCQRTFQRSACRTHDSVIPESWFIPRWLENTERKKYLFQK